MHVQIREAQPTDAPIVTSMVGELLHEIMAAIGEAAFNFDFQATERRAGEWLQRGHSLIWLAFGSRSGEPLGFVAVYESYALYAEGSFGTISELFVRSAHRSDGVGAALVAEVRRFAAVRRWTRLEVTTPPLPQFDRTLAFYSKQGFVISGGRKMKTSL